METVTTTIPARSRLEAMDWSLVLISQGIESVVERGEDRSWLLRVAPFDYESALQAIGLYKAENRRWGRQHQFFQPGLIFDWISLIWVALVCSFFWLNESRIDLRTVGVLDTVAVNQGEWWRLLTAVWLHADLAHLASNAMFGLILLGLAMGRYGASVGLTAAYLAGVGGNVASFLCTTHSHVGLGASGMVMGCLGLLAIQSVSMWRKTSGAWKHFLTGLFSGVMLFVLLGLSPGTDVVAHFGGFVCGLFLGAVMTHFTRWLRKPLPSLASGLVFLLLVLGPWWLALRHH